MDGEGTITITYKHGSEKYRSIQISISSTSPSLVKRVLDMTGVGSISQKKKYKEGHRQSYVWQVSGNQQCIALCEQLLPFLREEKKWKRAKKIVSEWNIVTVRNGKYSADAEQKKLAFEREFFEL